MKVAGSEKAGYRSVLYGKKEKRPDSIYHPARLLML
jgi:hypothetical protein